MSLLNAATSERLPGKLFRSLLTLCVLFCVVPVPLPTMTQMSRNQQEVAYPCQNRSCGCKSAYQCWTSCCCFSPQQRLDWAKKHGVTPPAYAVLPNGPKRQTATCSRCQPRTESKQCQRCCCSDGKKICQSDEANFGCSPKQRYLVVIEALRCGGHSADLTQLPWALPIIAKTSQYSSPAGGYGKNHSFTLTCRLADQPPAPPPRCLG